MSLVFEDITFESLRILGKIILAAQECTMVMQQISTNKHSQMIKKKKKKSAGASLVAQWLKIRLPVNFCSVGNVLKLIFCGYTDL